MKIYILLLLCNCTYFASFCQVRQVIKVDTTSESEQYWKSWKNDLYDMGPVFTKDSFKVSREMKRALEDTAYRTLLYPNKYTWQAAIALMKGMELKKAFWYMIKLYNADTANRGIIAGTVVAFESKIDMDRALTAAFYTYAFVDPDVCTIKNGKPEISRPDIIQNELNDVKKLCSYARSKIAIAGKK